VRLSLKRRRALLFVPVPAGNVTADRWRRACAAHCLQRNYRIISVTGDVATVQQLLDRRSVDVVVCGHMDHARLLDGIHPRVEVVADPPPTHPYGRRTGRRRLWGGP
jgi:UDP-2,3-diacylglucosamine pyrophosphatase LpxH